MFKRVSALCALGIAIFTASLEAQDLFVLPGSLSSGSEGQAFVTNPLTTYRTFTTGQGAFAILPNLAASTFFIVANSTENTVISTGTSLLTNTLVANLPAAATQAIVTPNGQVLAVAAGNTYLFSTASGNSLVAGGISQGSGLTTFAIAPSLDSTAIFALASSATGSELSSISTSSYAITTSLTLPQATAVSVGPNGLVYVSLPDEILELDPLTLQPTYNGTITVNGTPGQLVFTPDGQYAVSANQAAFSNSLIILSLANHSATTPTLGLPSLSSLLVTGTESFLALSNEGLYAITLSPLSVTLANVPNLTGGVQAGAVTNDVPAGIHTTVQSVYLLSGGTIYQYSPAAQDVTGQYAIASGISAGTISYLVPALTTAQSQPVSLLSFGNNQSILPNARSEPLVVQVLGTNNIPLSGVTVAFQSSGAAAALSTASAVTGANGYALVYLTAGDTSGPVTVTATAGSLTTNFSVNISTSAQNPGPALTIVAGQGQLMVEQTSTELGSQYGSPLQVLATDATGNPIANLPVTFSVPSGDGTIQVNGGGAASQTVNTNSSGIASVDFETTSLPANTITQGYFQTTVTASASNTNAVDFYITAVPNDAVTTVNLLSPSQSGSLTGAEGSTLANGLEAQVLSASGYGIPDVSLTLVDSVNPTLVPSVSCNAPGGVALTNSNGLASCGLTFGPRLGTGDFLVVIGATHVSVPIAFTVTPGTASAVQITQGNNQTGRPGQTLPLALVVHVTDSGGNTVQGATVAWKVTTAGTVTLSNVIGVTDSNGNASALATLGSVAGIAQVTATVGSDTATFNLTVNIPTAGLQKVAGDQQTAITNTAFATPLTVQVVDSSGNAIAGAQVNFQVTAGAATLNPSSAITNPAGQASTTVTAGATAGQLTVTAIVASFSVSFSLTVVPPGPSNITIVNGASFDPNTGISPGGIALIRGMGILSGVSGVVSAPLTNGKYPTTFSGVTISFSGTPAPIYYVASANGVDQVAIQVPFEVQTQPGSGSGTQTSMEVSVANETSATVTVPVKPVAPGIFTSIYSGKPYAVAVRPDGSYVSPTNPAQRGEDIQLYVTGLGQATPTIATDTPGVSDQPVVDTVVVGLNNGGVPLVSAIYVPGSIGVYLVTLHVPSNTATGPYQPVGLIAHDSADNNHYAQSTYIPIQ